MSEKRQRTKQQIAKMVMNRIIGIEAAYTGNGKLDKMEFATALRLYAGEVMKKDLQATISRQEREATQ